MIELPELIVGAIRSGLESAESPPTDIEVAKRTADIRDAVPEEHRATFDELLGEAKLTYRLRDERGTYADLWAIGIMRRAILAAGRRLAAQGVIDEPSHLVEADYRELRALVGSGTGVSGEELAGASAVPPGGALHGRAADHRRRSRASRFPPSGFPPAAARLERALGAVVQEIFVAPQPQTEERKVRGLGVSPGAYEGTARVIRGTSEFGRIEPGDVLVTNSTTTAFNIVLPLLGAIVTDRGGPALARCDRRARVRNPGSGRLHRRDPGAAGRRSRARGRGRGRGRGRVVRLAPLEESLDAELYGGKAAQLAVAVGAGLPGSTRASRSRSSS